MPVQSIRPLAPHTPCARQRPSQRRHRRLPLHVARSGVAALALTAAGAQAASYLETFGGPLNPAVWHLHSAGNDHSVSGGELVFTRQAHDAAWLEFAPRLTGDFDVSFRYRLIDWSSTYGGGDRLQLDVHNLLPQSRGHAINRYQEGGVNGGGHAGAVDSFCCTFLVGSSSTATLRITRSAGIVALSVDNGNGWQTVGPQSQLDTRDMTLRFSSYVHNGFVPGTRYAIDNFSIWAEGFSQPVPEPATGAMLAAGLAALGWVARRRRGA